MLFTKEFLITMRWLVNGGGTYPAEENGVDMMNNERKEMNAYVFSCW